jgi:peptidoglycan/LPS O-acetylase OafA/YrhL
MQRENHYPALDGLRGFAAIAVVEFHLGHWLGTPSLVRNGGIAVDLFFCLSGYVLPFAYGAGRRKALSSIAFTRTRLMRLMPLIVLSTLVSGTYVAFKLHIESEHTLYGAWLSAFLLGLLVLPYLNAPAAIGGPQVFPLNGPQFTLFLELLVNFVWFPIRRFAPLATALTLALAGGVLVGACGYGGDATATFWLGLPRVMASFFAGVAVFEIERRFGVAVQLRHAFWPLFVIMIALFAYPRELGIGVLLAWIWALAPLLILTGLKAEMGEQLRKLCLFGGKLSYPIYILQYPLFCWMNAAFQTLTRHKAPNVEMPLFLVAIPLGSYLVLRWLDAPVRRMVSAS